MKPRLCKHCNKEIAHQRVTQMETTAVGPIKYPVAADGWVTYTPVGQLIIHTDGTHCTEEWGEFVEFKDNKIHTYDHSLPFPRRS